MTCTLTDPRLALLRRHVAERLAQHRESLAGWSEGRACAACHGVGNLRGREPRSCLACRGRGLADVGYLVPTEPDPEARTITRHELVAAIAELEGIGRFLGEAT